MNLASTPGNISAARVRTIMERLCLGRAQRGTDDSRFWTGGDKQSR